LATGLIRSTLNQCNEPHLPRQGRLTLPSPLAPGHLIRTSSTFSPSDAEKGTDFISVQLALDLLAQLTNFGVRFVFFDMKGELKDAERRAQTPPARGLQAASASERSQRYA